MTLAIIFIIAAAFALGVVLLFAVSRKLPAPADAELVNRIQPIDVQAFRNLIDPRETNYLRRRLTPTAFRAVQRKRLRAAVSYLQALSQNASVLARVGQSALASSNGQVAEAARQLINDALLLRRNAVVALIRIYIELAWPQGNWAEDRVLPGYERLKGSAMLLGRLQHPEVPVRLSTV